MCGRLGDTRALCWSGEAGSRYLPWVHLGRTGQRGKRTGISGYLSLKCSLAISLMIHLDIHVTSEPRFPHQ